MTLGGKCSAEGNVGDSVMKTPIKFDEGFSASRQIPSGAGALQDGVKPEVEKARGSLLEHGSVLACRRAQAGRGDSRMVQFAGVAHIPTLQAFGGDLGMELQCQRAISECKGLIGVDFGLCQVERAGGQIEGVSMPMKDG
jgi:hypothetical protein